MRHISVILLIALSMFAAWRGLDTARYAVAQSAAAKASPRGVGEARLASWFDTPGLGALAREAQLSAGTNQPDQRQAVINLLGRAPLSPTQWLTAAAFDAAAGRGVEQLLTLSALAGPNEGAVMAQRGILGVSLWESLPDEQRRRSTGDLATAWSEMSTSDRRALQQILASKPERVRQEVQAALGEPKSLADVGAAARSLTTDTRRSGPGWFDPDWMSRRSILIDNSEGAADLADFQVKIPISLESGMRDDFSDIRFVDRDGTTLLSYWRESADAGRATFWIKVPFIPARGVVTVFMYYGNPDAFDQSAGTQTFLFFDDFSDPERFATQWTVVQSGDGTGVSVGRQVTETRLFTTKRSGRALISDHQLLYLSGDGPRGADSTIYKILDSKETGSFSGPPCTIGGTFRDDLGTLLLSSCGSAGAPLIWEVDPRSGQRMRSWHIPDPTFSAGVFVVDQGGSRVLIVSHDGGGRMRIRQATLVGSELAWTGLEWRYDHRGGLYGVAPVDGGLFLLASDGWAGCGLVRLELRPGAYAVSRGTWSLLEGSGCVGLGWDGQALYVSGAGAVRRLTPDFASSVKIQAHGASRMAFVASRSEVSLPVTVGVRARASGAFPGLLWLGDLTANTPNEAQNLLGIMPHPNGDPALIYVRQRELNDTPTGRAYRMSGKTSEWQRYEVSWSRDEVQYRQGETVLGAIPVSVPRTRLRLMLGGGTFGQPGFSAAASHIYIRAYATKEPSVSFGELASNPFPERGRLRSTGVSSPHQAK